MNAAPRIGQSSQQTRRVEPQHTIQFDGLPPLLATPWLIWHLEHTAIELLGPSLEPGELSVGTHVDWKHLAPAQLGDTVQYTARVIHCDGPEVTFQIEAHDGQESLGRGVHKRRVVSTLRLARRLESRRPSADTPDQ